MLVVRARRAGANAGSGHNSTVRPRPPKTTSPPLVRRPAGGTTSGPIASSAREQESWLGAVRTAVDQAHLRSDAVAGLNTLADSLASYADWHGPAVARPPWAVLMAGAGRSRSWVGRRLAWLREHGLLVIAEHGLANRPAAYLLTIPTRPRRDDSTAAGTWGKPECEQASLEGVRARHDRRLAISGDPEGDPTSAGQVTECRSRCEAMLCEHNAKRPAGLCRPTSPDSRGSVAKGLRVDK